MKRLVFAWLVAYLLIQVVFVTAFGFFHEWSPGTTELFGLVVFAACVLVGTMWQFDLLIFKRKK